MLELSYRAPCHGEAASLVMKVLWTRHSPVVCFICLSGC